MQKLMGDLPAVRIIPSAIPAMQSGLRQFERRMTKEHFWPRLNDVEWSWNQLCKSEELNELKKQQAIVSESRKLPLKMGLFVDIISLHLLILEGAGKLWKNRVNNN